MLPRPKKILLIEDDPDDLLMFMDAVRELDPLLSIQHCPNGFEAMETLRHPPDGLPDIIFLDVNMPTMTGWDCLQELKKIPGVPGIPVIMYSTADLNEGNVKPQDVGAAAFYQKSDSFDHLKSTLAIVLARYSD